MLDQQNSSEDFVLDRFTPYQIVVLGNSISKLLARSYADEFDISVPEWRVLAVICQYDGTNAQSVTERTPMDKVAVSRAVTGLVDKGWVIKAISRDDRRAASLSPSREGRRLYEKIATIALSQESDILSVLSEKEQQQLRTLLAKLLERVSALSDN